MPAPGWMKVPSQTPVRLSVIVVRISMKVRSPHAAKRNAELAQL
jgi:hypothetical protein